MVEILPHERQGSPYVTLSKLRLLMTRLQKEPGHQQPCYSPSLPRIIHSQHLDSLQPGDTIGCQMSWSTLVQIMAWCLFGTKPLSETMLTSHQLESQEQLLWNLNLNTNIFSQKNAFGNLICRMSTISFPASMCYGSPLTCGLSQDQSVKFVHTNNK